MSDKPEKPTLYSEYLDFERWRNKLHKRLAHKSLDIPLDEDMNVTNTRVGLGWKELAVIAATGLGGFYLWNQTNQPATPTQPAAVSPNDSEYDVRFYNAEGELIKVPHLDEMKQ